MFVHLCVCALDSLRSGVLGPLALEQLELTPLSACTPLPSQMAKVLLTRCRWQSTDDKQNDTVRSRGYQKGCVSSRPDFLRELPVSSRPVFYANSRFRASQIFCANFRFRAVLVCFLRGLPFSCRLDFLGGAGLSLGGAGLFRVRGPLFVYEFTSYDFYGL